MHSYSLRGILAATLTPFHPDGSLNLNAIEAMAAHLVRQGVRAVFIGGTTGESHSLSLDERRALSERWVAVARGAGIEVIVHVGSNCLADSRVLAAQAQDLGATGISAVAPAYFKPRTIAAQVECCAQVAAAAPALPFFHYDIPGMTGVSLPMAEFLERAAERIPNLAGLKFSNLDLMMFQQCLRANGGRCSVAWGCDEALLSALVLGCKSAVGSTYNYSGPIANRLWAAFDRGDLAAAREEQFRIVQLVDILNRRGYLASAKVLMGMLGVELGPVRLPNLTLDAAQQAAVRSELEALGFRAWIGR